MMSTVSVFVESEGITLPDGSVYGAGFTHMYDITHGDNGGDYLDVFRVYQIVGDRRISVADPMTYKEMRNFLTGEANHYKKNGMRLWKANHSDFEKATHKVLVPCE